MSTSPRRLLHPHDTFIEARQSHAFNGILSEEDDCITMISSKSRKDSKNEPNKIFGLK